MARVVEIRSYVLRPGTRPEFERLVREEAEPMLRRWSVDVVAHGPSLHDAAGYYLMRAYDDAEHRQQSQDAFYGSDEWRQGPREPMLALIESYTDVLIELDESAIAGLRRGP